MKIYLAHGISTTGEFVDSKRVANNIRDIGYEVYVASENDSINDKSNEPTPLDIYEGDINEILDAAIFVVNLSGGLQDGTISEIGFVAGLNELGEGVHEILGVGVASTAIIAYTSNARLLQPQYSDGIPSASANHLVKGMIDRWGEFVGDEEAMYRKLYELKHGKEASK